MQQKAKRGISRQKIKRATSRIYKQTPQQGAKREYFNRKRGKGADETCSREEEPENRLIGGEGD